jgi:hypothetical protein
MFKEAVKLGKEIYNQKHTKVTIELLENSGFTRLTMGDLQLYEISAGQFYYINPKEKYTLIQNAYVLANLIYGRTKYAK